MGVTTTDMEFPLLQAVGLYVKETEGNGNCLFNALSDQLFGDQSKHGELRLGVIRHMRENAEHYKKFIAIHPGGGSRRNPKRKNAGSFSTPFDNTRPTPEEINRVFESHLQQMARGGTYGDNMEISAFSKAFRVDVKIYQRDFAYVVSTKPVGTVVPVVHIAYHVYEHYSSIRNRDGPHTGLPHVKMTCDPSEVMDANAKLANAPHVQPWMVRAVMQSLPWIGDEQLIHKIIEECKGDIDASVSKLLDAEERSSTSSGHGSSSVEREEDSDDEDIFTGPKKRQDRRLSRAKRQIAQEKEERSTQDLSYRPKVDHLPVSIGHPSSSKATQAKVITLDENCSGTDEDEWRTVSSSKSSESPSAASSSTSATDSSNNASKSQTVGVRLKLTQPKRHATPSNNQPNRPNVSTQPSIGRGNTGKGLTGQQGQQGQPQQKRMTSRDKRDKQKADQKAAAKSRKQGIAADRSFNGPSTVKPLKVKQDKENAPMIEAHINVLYI